LEKEKYKVLVVDDEPQIAGLLKVCLEMQGMEVIEAYDGRKAFEMFNAESFDLIITDVMMPVIDGYELVEKIRQKSHVPVLFLTAKGDVLDRIKGLNIGADDYIVKPFDPMEVAARVLSTLRRCYGYDGQGKAVELVCGSLRLDVDLKRLYKNGEAIELTALEYRIVECFMSNIGHVLTKDRIYEAAWESDKFPDDNSIMVAISKLRSKISDDGSDYIHTIRGLGYRMEEK
jgi:DNA-binding response OmpR family regulator